jgi:hypothetical protein
MLFEIKSQMVYLYFDKCPCNNKQKKGRDKEAFYNLLQQNITQIARSDIKTVLGDFKLLKKTYTIGNESLHNKSNNNGIKMIQFAISNGLNVRSTFPHKDIHKETWYSADGRTANQIDHALISNRFTSAKTDTRALRKPDIVSDNKLLKINFIVKLRVKTMSKYNQQ